METDLASFIVSIMAFLSCIVLFYSRKNARVFYAVMSVGWIGGIVYYSSVLFFDFGTWKVVSNNLILFQYIVFSGWFIYDAFESFALSLRNCKGIKSLCGRVIRLWNSLIQLYR